MQENSELLQPTPETESAELAPLQIIRSETVLSKLPIHNLSKKGKIDINVIKRNGRGEVELRWEVSHSDRYGQARQLAYKLDTIMINRRIDEAGRPLPKVICLGSLREISDELNLGGDTNSIKKALRQNAFTGITAKVHYKAIDGSEKTLEADFTRYSVVFTGEKLPDGRKADSVYIVLNEPYWEVLNNAPQRPLDYDYLKSLTPAPQRFYEIVSFRIYAALKNRQPYARLSYSDYCTFSAQQRYFTYDQFKKQMHKVHLPHKRSGYLDKVEYQDTTDDEGKVDWMMLYTPGPKAKAEFAAFTRNPQIIDIKTKETRRGRGEKGSVKSDAAPQPMPAEHHALLSQFTKRGIIESGARKILEGLANHEQVIDQLEYGDFLISQNGSIRNPPGFYLSLIKENIAVPENFETSRKRKLREDAQEQKSREAYERLQMEDAYREYESREVDRFIESHPTQYAEIFAAKHQSFIKKFPQSSTWDSDVLQKTIGGMVRAEIIKAHLSLQDYDTFCASHRVQQNLW